jgi:hypothetical protein
MQYRCPLCLKLLERDDRVAKFCPRHRNANPHTFAPYETVESQGGFRCSVEGCPSHQVVRPDGLLFRHVDCSLDVNGISHPSTNPFWNGTAVAIDNFVVTGTPPNEKRSRVDHWQIDALSQLLDKSASEMWFPAALLPGKGDRDRHVLVSLTGAKNAGKTYLAMRALDETAYAQKPRPTDDFFFIHQGAATAGPAADFLQTLYLRQLLRSGQPDAFAEQLTATTVRPRNLKVALFPQPASRRRVPWFLRWGPLEQTYIDVRDALTQRGGEPETNYRALMLYDIAGESVELDHVVVDRHDGEMDVVAVMLSMEDLMNRDRDSVQARAAARTRLSRLLQMRTTYNQALRICLIVSKCDVMQGIVPTDRAALERKVVELARERGEDLIAEALSSAGQAKATIDRLFFTARVATGDRNDLYGLEEFVRWCLNT